MAFGVTTDYEGCTPKHEAIEVWSGPFYSVFEAEGGADVGASSYELTTYNGDEVTVELPEGVTAPRSDENFHVIDEAISTALDAHYKARGVWQMKEH